MNEVTCRTLIAVAMVLAGPACSGRPAQAGDEPGRGPEIVERLGLERSTKHRNLVIASIELTNNLLSLDTKYQLALDPAPAGSIPVYLVSGADLFPDTTAYVPRGERYVILNADLIARCVQRFGFAYDDARLLADPHPKYGIFAETDDWARKVLAVLLMHEVGHIWIQDHHDHYKGIPVAAYDKIVAAAGNQKLEELEADKFCADRLRKARELNLLLSQEDGMHKMMQGIISRVKAENPNADSKQLLEAVGRASRQAGRQMRAADNFEGFVFQAGMKVDKKGYLDGRPIVPSHIDLDLRLLTFMEVAYGDVRQDEALAPILLDDRAGEAKYKVAYDDAVASAGGDAAVDRKKLKDPYYLDRILLKHPDIGVRSQEAIELRKKKALTPDILPDLIAALRREHGETPNITYTLSSMGRVAVPDLIRCLSAKNPEVRCDAALCLLQMGPRNNVEAVTALLKAAKDSDDCVRQKAILALEAHGYNPTTLAPPRK